MPKFMFLQRGDCDKSPEMAAEQMTAHMESCMQWMKNGQEEGWLLDPGSPLSRNGAIVESDLTLTDGPFAETKELVGGYTIVQAPDLATACELAKRTIKMTSAGRIEVREIATP